MKYFISMPFLLIAVGFPRRKKKQSLDRAETLIYLQRIINGAGLRLWYGPCARFDATVRIPRREKQTHAYTQAHADRSSCRKKNAKHSCMHGNKQQQGKTYQCPRKHDYCSCSNTKHIAKTSQGSPGLTRWSATDYWHVLFCSYRHSNAN